MDSHSQNLELESELQRLLQKRKLLMLERDIARKGRQARRELDRAARVESKKMAKAMARQASGQGGAAAATTQNQRAEADASWISRAIVQPILGKLSGARKHPTVQRGR